MRWRRQDIFERNDQGAWVAKASFYTQDGLFDCAWSEESDQHLVSVSGDGSIKLWDIRARNGRPVKAWKEHSQEIFSVDWNVIKKDVFLTASWDEKVKLWSPNAQNSIRTFHEHRFCIYSVAWDPMSADRFATASGDLTLKIWDARSPRSTQTVQAHPNEVLSCDWSKYDQHVLVSGSVDKAVRVWDLRRPLTPLVDLHGHNFAVKKVKCSPHRRNLLASVSYDRSFCLWDIDRPARGVDPLVEKLELHSEFAIGVDFNIFIEGLVATCGWDSTVALWKLGTDPKT